MNFRHLSFFLTLISAVSCRTAPKPSDTLAAANMAALEQSVDMENNTVETDEVLKFARAVLDLGEIPLGESRELTLEAVNRSEKPLVLLDAYTSCHCTKVTWDKKPVPAGGQTLFKIHFTAEQPGTFFKKIAVRHSANPGPVTFSIQVTVTKGIENRPFTHHNGNTMWL